MKVELTNNASIPDKYADFKPLWLDLIRGLQDSRTLYVLV